MGTAGFGSGRVRTIFLLPALGQAIQFVGHRTALRQQVEGISSPQPMSSPARRSKLPQPLGLHAGKIRNLPIVFSRNIPLKWCGAEDDGPCCIGVRRHHRPRGDSRPGCPGEPSSPMLIPLGNRVEQFQGGGAAVRRTAGAALSPRDHCRWKIPNIHPSYTPTGCLLDTGTGVSHLCLSAFSPRMIA
jgi:hypothetical protein